MENYLEYQEQKEKNETNEETFTLKKFEKENNLKFLIAELNPKEELSTLILNITSAITYGNYLITGNNIGSINIYSLEEQKLINILICPIKEQINALDIDDDGEFIFAGLSNDNIVIYDLSIN